MGGADARPRLPPTRWRRAADRLGRYSITLLLIVVGLAVLGGIVATLIPDSPSETSQMVEECKNPPCFGGGGAPSVRALPTVLPAIGFAIAILLGVPSLLLALADLFQGRVRSAGRLSLLFLGPLLVLIGTEVVPHVLSPCLPAQLGIMARPGVCELTPHGVDVKNQWHPLTHALLGAVPMVLLYRLALRRFRPDLVLPDHRASLTS